MVSKKLYAVWAFLALCLLVSGVVALAFSIVWRKPDVLMNMVISSGDLTAGTVLGVFLLVTFFLSVGAIIQPNHVTVGLVALNWLLIMDSLGIVVIGTFVWFFTLRERANFHALWIQASEQTRTQLQDQLSCCGYFSSIDNAVIGGTHCADINFVQSLNLTEESNFCVAPITKFADETLNNIFTYVERVLRTPSITN
ncbi:hypothetical protein ONZ45_g16860 [Pleurotus djamor]|nr:hypothetical protein ONZ45_g16860 [Pleurotus djamor]